MQIGSGAASPVQLVIILYSVLAGAAGTGFSANAPRPAVAIAHAAKYQIKRIDALLRYPYDQGNRLPGCLNRSSALSKNKGRKHDQVGLLEEVTTLPPTLWQLHPLLTKVFLGLALAPVPIAFIFDTGLWATRLLPLTSKIVSPYLLTEYGQTILRIEAISPAQIAEDDLRICLFLFVLLIQLAVVVWMICANAGAIRTYILAKRQRDGDLSYMREFVLLLMALPVLGIIDLMFGGYIMHWIEPVSQSFYEHRRGVAAGYEILVLIGLLWLGTVYGVGIWLAARFAPENGTSQSGTVVSAEAPKSDRES
ncbi:MAG TPA: hypothetical protein VN229_15390 [Terriglobales bacterium]|nr:hypothetical protein [Terriglobales bacterium]